MTVLSAARESRLSMLTVVDVLVHVRVHDPDLRQDTEADVKLLLVQHLWVLLSDQQSLVNVAILMIIPKLWNSFAARGGADQEAATDVNHQITLTLISPGHIKTQLAVY